MKKNKHSERVLRNLGLIVTPSAAYSGPKKKMIVVGIPRVAIARVTEIIGGRRWPNAEELERLSKEFGAEKVHAWFPKRKELRSKKVSALFPEPPPPSKSERSWRMWAKVMQRRPKSKEPFPRETAAYLAAARSKPTAGDIEGGGE
jgi:hypothetical protein